MTEGELQVAIALFGPGSLARAPAGVVGARI